MDHKTDDAQFWDWTFEDVGREDVPRLAEFIIDERKDDTCAKVTVVTHSTGVSEVITAALSDTTFSSRVDRVVALAPCTFLNLNNFELPIGDRPSA